MLVSAKEGVTITYASGGNGTVSDVAGNALATDATGVLVAAWDTTAPTLVSATKVTTTSLNVVISELCDQTSITNANDGGWLVKETGAPGTAYTVS